MLPYYPIRSPLNADHRPERCIHALQEALGEEMVRVTLDEYLQSPFALLYVASGGSESFFLEVFAHLRDRPCFILTSGENNSLAASMEILSYLKKHGGRGEILHGDPILTAEKIRFCQRIHCGLTALKGKTLGCIGAPSDWLIASDYAPDTVSEKLGLGFVSIPLEELLSETAVKQVEDNEYTQLFRSLPFDPEETEKALQIYGAFKRLTDRYRLCGVTVRCFDLLDTVRSTGCLGLSILNSLGIPAACEGDLPALLSMAILHSITGDPSFMCNPSRFDTRAGRAVFAHCTVPTGMLESFRLNTHFESGIGVAVQGTFAEGDCTLFKCSGDLGRFHMQEGRIKQAPFDPHLCRTQVTVELDDLSYFLTDPIGNHHILCRGKHAAEINAFFRLLA